MTAYRAISVDDETSAHDALRALLSGIPDVNLAAAFTSPLHALSALRSDHYDLLFLDVAMPEMSGLEILKALEHPPLTVLLTARVEYALTAFDLGVRDYLLKPVSAARLHKCLDHIRPLLDAERADLASKAPPRLSIKCGNEHRLIDPGQTPRIEAEGNFSIVHSAGREILASETMKDLEQRLSPFGFVRIHRSHLVNIETIRSISSTEVRMADGQVLPLGRAYRAAVTEAIHAQSIVPDR